MKKLLFTIFALIFLTQMLVAQNLKQANSLFERRAYLNAAELYLIEEPKTQEIYEKLGDCYYFNSKMKLAALYYEILVDQYEQNLSPTYLFRYSQSLKGNEKYNKADKWLKKYYDKRQIDSVNVSETIAFFDSLNKQIKRPYILHTISSNSTSSDLEQVITGILLCLLHPEIQVKYMIGTTNLILIYFKLKKLILAI